MNGRERITGLLRKEKVDRVPWVPFAGVHAGKLKGYTAKEVLQDKDKLVASLLEVKKIYQPDGMPVVFDLQIEAEILGCELLWAENNPPSVKSHPLAQTKDIPSQIPSKDDGRLPMILEAMKEVKEKVGDDTALYGLFTGPFTLASHLRGQNFFMDMAMDPEYCKNLLNYTAQVAKAMCDYFIEVGMDVISIVCPLVSQVSPKHFGALLSEPYKEVFDHIRSQGALSSFFVCGNAGPNIENMCKTNPDSISVDENIDMVKAKEISDKYDIVIGGNIPLTTVMLHGTQQDNMKYVVDLLDKVSHEKLIIAPGCDMPYDLPIENTIAIQQAIVDTEKARDIIKDYTAVEEDPIEIVLPDYENLKKPFVEVFTLDSISCAACTYMMGAATDAKEHFGDAIDVIEYKFTEKKSIARCKKMGVGKLPSMYLNGELAYSSIIPSREELFTKIKALLYEETLIDIYLVTGFLGAGKTTLMKNLVKVFENEKVALIVNEFGQEGVDGAVLEKEGMVIEQIVDGSIFCVCRSDRFIDAILKTKEMGIDSLLVESSGLANPFGMHEVTGMLHKLSPDTFHYSGSICVVDAKHFKKLSDLVPVLIEQVQGADLLLINKTDLVSPEEVAKVEKIIRKLNSEVPIIRTSFARIPDDTQIQTLRWHRGTMKGFLVKQTPGIDKFVLKFGPVPVDQLVIWLKKWADRVYRVKGFCSEDSRQFYVQAVHDDVRVSELDHKPEGNFLIVLGPADDEMRKMIQSSWSKHFQTELTLA